MCGDMLAAFIIIKTVLMHTFVDVFLESAMNMYKKIQITLNMASKGWKKDINVLSRNIMKEGFLFRSISNVLVISYMDVTFNSKQVEMVCVTFVSIQHHPFINCVMWVGLCQPAPLTGWVRVE